MNYQKMKMIIYMNELTMNHNTLNKSIKLINHLKHNTLDMQMGLILIYSKIVNNNITYIMIVELFKRNLNYL